MSLPAFSVRQSVLVNVLFFVLILGGLGAYARIPVEFFTDINLNEAQIITVWPGASADEMERLVTQKLEEELLSVNDVDQIRSKTGAGVSTIFVEFDEFLSEPEYEAALNDVRAALEQAEELPEDAEEPIITELKLGEVSPVVMVAIVDEGDVGPLALREISRDIQGRLRDLPGVHRIQIRGEQDREVKVRVDQNAAARYGLAVPDIAQRIRRQNLNVPAGTFETEAGEQVLRAVGDYQNLGEIRSTVVAENDDGTYVRLSELATVEEELVKSVFKTRFQGKPALLVSITKKSSADVIDLVAEVDRWLEGYRPRLPEGVSLTKTLDTARFVQSRMGILVDNLITGIAFVVIALWFTISFRNAMLTAIAIPFSFLTAMILFPVFGVTLNATTITGMLLVSGMLVDDAIIVLENIYSKIEDEVPLMEAVIKGAEEVMWPVTAAIATTCAAFLPLLLVGGTSGKFVSILPKAVVLCLIASLLECLVILPAHYLDFGSRRSRKAEKDAPSFFAPVRNRVEAGLAWMRDQYAKALDLMLSHRGAFGALFLSVFFLAFAGAQHLRVDLFPGEFDTFNVLLEMPSESTIEQTDQVARGYEEILREFLGKEVEDFSSTVGMSVDINYDFLIGPNYSMTTLTLLESEENAREPEAVLFRVQEKVAEFREAWPGPIVDLRVQAEQDGPPLGAPIEMRLQGEDYALGKAVAGEVKAFLETVPGVYNIEDNLKPGSAEIQLVVDEERAARHGLGFEDLANALRGANNGVIASSFRDPTRNEDVAIRVQLAVQHRNSLQELLDVDVTTPGGYLVKLRDVADVEKTRGYRSYARIDGKRTVTVVAQVDGVQATSLSANQALQARFADLEERYPQLDVRMGGEFEESGEAFADLTRALPVALVAIYMVLAALFRSYLQPFVVGTAVPFAFVGIILGVSVLGYSVSFVLLYAAIGLTGVVVNDSLVMVDFINRARNSGLPMLEAVRQSGVRRFRPILLTTLTTVMALMPMALGLQGSSKTYGPFAAAISFGLIIAMIGTLFAVPLTYASLLAGQERIATWRAQRRGGVISPTGAEGTQG